MIKKLSMTLLALTSSFGFAGTMGVVVDTFNPSLYLKVGSGGSWSMNSDIQPDNEDWAPAIQGYNANLGSTALYSAAIGYNLNPLWSFDFDYIYRPSYQYDKYQDFLPSSNYSSVSRTRVFNLASNSLMANAYLHGKGLSDSLAWNVGSCYTLEPFIGAGLGVAFNTLYNFHSEYVDGEAIAIMNDNFRTSFAWQLSAGLNLFNDSHFNLAAGYRYYNGGTFTSNNYYGYSPENGVGAYSEIASPWKGSLQANEFFVTLAYKIDA